MPPVAEFTPADLVRTTNAFLGAYGIGDGDFRTDLGDATPLHFWEAAFVRQTLVDASRLTGEWTQEIDKTYYRYEDTHAVDRFGNPKCWIANDTDWNDDYSWAVQFALAAYDVTGDAHLLDQAKWHTDFFYRDFYDDGYGGGFWRERGTKDQKDVPSNGFGVAAAELARHFPAETVHNNSLGTDKPYLEIAHDTYLWLKTSFLRDDGRFENSFSGREWDNNLYTYNAGVFLELVANLFDLTQDETYLADGIRVADFAKKHFTTGRDDVIVYEDDVDGRGRYRPDPVESYEIVFKGILLRGLSKFITFGGQAQYLDWLGANAQATYGHRTDDLPSAVFDRTVSNARGTGAATGLAAMTYALTATSW